MWAAGTFYILLLRNRPFAQTVILQDIVSFLGISSSSPVHERARAIQIASRVLSLVPSSVAGEAPEPLLFSETAVPGGASIAAGEPKGEGRARWSLHRPLSWPTQLSPLSHLYLLPAPLKHQRAYSAPKLFLAWYNSV